MDENEIPEQEFVVMQMKADAVQLAGEYSNTMEELIDNTMEIFDMIGLPKVKIG